MVDVGMAVSISIKKLVLILKNTIDVNSLE